MQPCKNALASFVHLMRLGQLNFVCLHVVFCLVLGGGEEIPAKKPATEGEFHRRQHFS